MSDETQPAIDQDLWDAHVLVTDTQMTDLLDNHGRGADAMPVLKIFNPVGAGTWIIHSVEPDQDTLFGLCDLGVGSPELGSISLPELQQIRSKARFSINGVEAGSVEHPLERDLYFHPEHPLEVYVEAARTHGMITETEQHLEEAEAADRLRNRAR